MRFVFGTTTEIYRVLNVSVEPTRTNQSRTVAKTMSDEPDAETTQQDDTEWSLCELAGILTDERRQRDAEAANLVVDLLES